MWHNTNRAIILGTGLRLDLTSWIGQWQQKVVTSMHTKDGMKDFLPNFFCSLSNEEGSPPSNGVDSIKWIRHLI